MELVFAYLAGLLTLINPCVLPIIPIILASSLQADRRGPLALALGMGLAFVVLGVFISAIGPFIGLSQQLVAQIAAAMMIAFGLVLLIPRFSAVFATATAGIAAKGGEQLDQVDGSTLRGQFWTGALLGAVWSPCTGPTLLGAISAASLAVATTSTGAAGGEAIDWAATNWAALGWAAVVMSFFALGVATFIVGISLGSREALRKRAASLRGFAEKSKPIMGGVLVVVGLFIILGLHHMLDEWLIEVFPSLSNASVNIEESLLD